MMKASQSVFPSIPQSNPFETNYDDGGNDGDDHNEGDDDNPIYWECSMNQAHNLILSS